MPSGWIVLTYTKFYEIEPNSYVDVIIPVQGNGQAESGTFKLIMTTLEGSTFELFDELEVIYLPKPSIEFLDLQLNDGQEIDLEGGEKPPIGVDFKIRWAISNDGSRSFTPNDVIIQSNNDWDAVCDPLETFEPSGISHTFFQKTLPNSVKIRR